MANKVRLIDTAANHYGRFIEVELQDGPELTLEEALRQINEKPDGWERDDKIAEVIVHCPVLFNQYFEDQNRQD